MPLPQTPQELAFHVDRHGVLAVPAVFWVGLLILSRQLVLLLLVGLSSRRDGGQSAALVAGASVPWLALAGQTLALLVCRSHLKQVRQSRTQWQVLQLSRLEG